MCLWRNELQNRVSVLACIEIAMAIVRELASQTERSTDSRKSEPSREARDK
jgi:hypothetical protein